MGENECEVEGCRKSAGRIQEGCRKDAGKIQERFRENPGKIQSSERKVQFISPWNFQWFYLYFHEPSLPFPFLGLRIFKLI
jgi:hypothetical protein